MVAPMAREMKPVTAIRLPMLSFVISAGSGNFFDQSRQNTTAPARQLTDKIESRVISQVVGIFLPKKTRFRASLRPDEIGVEARAVFGCRSRKSVPKPR